MFSFRKNNISLELKQYIKQSTEKSLFYYKQNYNQSLKEIINKKNNSKCIYNVNRPIVY